MELDLVGKTLADRYAIEEKLGEGAMGTVFRARHVKVGRMFAVKVLHPRLLDDAKQAERFQREAEVAGTLRHPNVVGVVDVGVTPDGLRYLVMEHAVGEPLVDLLGTPLPATRVISLVRQLLEGLHHAHSRGLIHRDFKPDNVIVERRADGTELPRIVDFGIAILREDTSSKDRDRLTTKGVVLGTPAYMAPEQAFDESFDHRVDLFALGVTCYEMLTGRLPFEGDNVDVIRANVTTPTPPMGIRVPFLDVDPLLEAFTRRLMNKKADERPVSANEALRLLDLIDRDRTAAALALGIDPQVARGPAGSRPAVATAESQPTRPVSEPGSLDSVPKLRPSTAPVFGERPRTAPPVAEGARTAPPVPERARTAPPVAERARTAPPVGERPSTAPLSGERPSTAPFTERPSTAPPSGWGEQPPLAVPIEVEPSRARRAWVIGGVAATLIGVFAIGFIVQAKNNDEAAIAERDRARSTNSGTGPSGAPTGEPSKSPTGEPPKSPKSPNDESAPLKSPTDEPSKPTTDEPSKPTPDEPSKSPTDEPSKPTVKTIPKPNPTTPTTRTPKPPTPRTTPTIPKTTPTSPPSDVTARSLADLYVQAGRELKAYGDRKGPRFDELRARYRKIQINDAMTSPTTQRDAARMLSEIRSEMAKSK